MGSFASKLLTATLTLDGGSFGPNGENSVVVDGLRMILEVEKGGSPSKNEAKLRIYGMDRKTMDALTTTAFKPLEVRKSFLDVQAGDMVNGIQKTTTAFRGEISGAWVVLHEPPGVYFRVESCSGYYPALAPAAPKGYSGPTSVAQVLAGLAAEMGYGFENNGVDMMMGSPYLWGSAWHQAKAIAEAADLEWGIDDDVLWIAPRYEARAGDAPLLAPHSGLIGYPTFDKEGLRARCLYNPAVQVGGLVQVQSSVSAACGTWRVHGLKHHLEANHPGGKWETQIAATWPKGA